MIWGDVPIYPWTWCVFKLGAHTPRGPRQLQSPHLATLGAKGGTGLSCRSFLGGLWPLHLGWASALGMVGGFCGHVG